MSIPCLFMMTYLLMMSPVMFIFITDMFNKSVVIGQLHNDVSSTVTLDPLFLTKPVIVLKTSSEGSVRNYVLNIYYMEL